MKYQHKYRVESARKKGFNYANNGYYFITITLKGFDKVFGAIVDKKVHLSATGIIARDLWQEIPNQFPFAQIDEFVIMPDHIHGIIRIDKPLDIGTSPNSRDAIHRVSNQNAALNNIKTGGITKTDNSMITQNSISYIIRWYKARVTYDINHFPITNAIHPTPIPSVSTDAIHRVSISPPSLQTAPTEEIPPHLIPKKFRWQSRFHDHIINSKQELIRIRNYIKYNPRNWKK